MRGMQQQVRKMYQLDANNVVATCKLGNDLSIRLQTEGNQEKPVSRWPVAGHAGYCLLKEKIQSPPLCLHDRLQGELYVTLCISDSSLNMKLCLCIEQLALFLWILSPRFLAAFSSPRCARVAWQVYWPVERDEEFSLPQQSKLIIFTVTLSAVENNPR